MTTKLDTGLAKAAYYTIAMQIYIHTIPPKITRHYVLEHYTPLVHGYSYVRVLLNASLRLVPRRRLITRPGRNAKRA